MLVTVNGIPLEFAQGERLIDLINRMNKAERAVRTGARDSVELPQVCYHPQLGPIQTCDTCMVEADGKLVRACATPAADGMRVETNSPRASAAQREAMDRILGNHMLYCTVCDNNNGNCTVHNTTKLLGIEHQEIPFKNKPYEVDSTNPFYRYDPQQ
ncbi:MAG: 2Fe-2S iron-sulfur cluster-binding protein, partial [Terracidiphilus sp.]